MNDLERGWVAGIFEGEGCIYLPPSGTSVRLTVPSVDLDTAERFRDTVGFGAIYQQGYTTSAGEARVIHRWQSGALADVQAFLGAILPLLSERRAAKAQQALAVVPNPNGRGPRKLRAECQRGHTMTGDNVLPGRRCRVCRNERARLRAAGKSIATSSEN